MCFSGYLVVLFEAITSEKSLYIIDPFRQNLDPYDQTAFIEIQAPLTVQKALKRAFSEG